MFRRRAKRSTVALSSLLGGGSLAAYAIFIHGIQVSAVTKALFVIVLIFLSISIPALLLLGLCKLVASAIRKTRKEE